jgi:hypothetical protein
MRARLVNNFLLGLSKKIKKLIKPRKLKKKITEKTEP